MKKRIIKIYLALKQAEREQATKRLIEFMARAGK
jgi:hypothetical protein